MGSKQKSLTVAEVFAENLRRECRRFSSIAEFCRKARINRQQFNRYLAGQNLPNPGSLQKICAALGISELQLFDSHQRQDAQPGNAPPANDALSSFLPHIPAATRTAIQQAITAHLGHGEARGVLPPGVYLAYMPLAGFRGQIVCTAMKVSHVGGLTVFTRRTSFRARGEAIADYTVGKHMGVILSDAAATTFIGINKIFPHEMSVMRVMHTMASPNAPILGLSVVRSPVGELACKVVFTPLGAGPAAERKALGRVGIIKPGDAALPASVALHLSNQVMPESQTHDYVAINELLQMHQHLTAKLAAGR